MFAESVGQMQLCHKPTSMKKLNIFLLTLCMVSLSYAQEGFKLGLRFSPAITWFTVTDSSGNVQDGYKSKMGFSTGLLFNYGFTENYAIHSGLRIMMQGTQSEVGIISSNVSLTTVQIPIGFKMRSNEIGSGIFIKGLIGATADVHTAYKYKVTINGTSSETKANDNVQPFGASFLIGAGIEYEWDGVGTFDFGLSYLHGLTNINRKNKSGWNGQIKPKSISLDLGYYF